ncbi:MFS transporter [Hoyosella altamirensis]|uniref:MFS family permease n=1 Tax=Hoyosella altamirensis TaxID=616997 RepID=A0A839RKP4_9ACTN|nr:MFS transporter [Hoyosella altamirensis]MBB3037030.1 MFS family permease [Hoyosella altamirensis]
MTPTFRRLLIVLLAGFTAHQMLVPLVAPLGRALALTETQMGLVVSVSALSLAVSSPIWGRALDKYGPTVVLTSGLLCATIGLAGFAIAVSAGLDQTLEPATVMTVMLITRSIFFGTGIAALPVVAIAAATASARDEAQRTKAVGFVGAAQGLSLVLGPAAGGALAAASLMAPLIVSPIVLGLLGVWVAARVRPEVRATSIDTTPLIRVRPWDTKVFAALSIAFLLYLSLALIQVVIGFLIADRLLLGPEQTAGAVGIALFLTGVVLVVTQAALVPRLGWPALRLVRVGAPIVIVSFALLLGAGQLWAITAAFMFLALGLGLAIPGFTVLPTLAVDERQAGAVAGLITATTGLTFVIGPVTGTALYEVSEYAPIAASIVVATIAGVVAFSSRALRATRQPGATVSAPR